MISYVNAYLGFYSIVNITYPSIRRQQLYLFAGLKPEAGAFFFFTLMVLFTGYASVGIGLFYSASFDTFAVATLFLTMTYVFSIVSSFVAFTSFSFSIYWVLQIFAGLLVNIDTIFPWLGWLEYLSVARYSFSVSANTVFSRKFS